jgi:hypothetical protein
MGFLRDRHRGNRIDQHDGFTITVARYPINVREVGAFRRPKSDFIFVPPVPGRIKNDLSVTLEKLGIDVNPNGRSKTAVGERINPGIYPAP